MSVNSHHFVPFSVVIPLYNDWSNYTRYFDANYQLIKSIHSSNEIILVDDTKNDDIVIDIRQKKYDVKIISHQKNEGFSRSANDGILQALYEVVFLLNSDISIKNDSLLNALSHFTDPSVFAVSLKSVYPDGKIREGAKKLIRQFGLPKMKHSPKDYPKPDSRGRIISAYPVGGHCAVRKSYFTSLGGFDTIVFHPFYWEDADLGYRAQQKGWITVYEPTAEVVHPKEDSTIKNNYQWDYIRFIRRRNRIFFALKHFNKGISGILLKIGLYVRFLQLLVTKGLDEAKKETIDIINEYRSLFQK